MRHQVECVGCVAPHDGLHNRGEGDEIALVEDGLGDSVGFFDFGLLVLVLHHLDLGQVVALELLEVVVPAHHDLLSEVRQSARVRRQPAVLHFLLKKVRSQWDAWHHVRLSRVIARRHDYPLCPLAQTRVLLH